MSYTKPAFYTVAGSTSILAQQSCLHICLGKLKISKIYRCQNLHWCYLEQKKSKLDILPDLPLDLSGFALCYAIFKIIDPPLGLKLEGLSIVSIGTSLLKSMVWPTILKDPQGIFSFQSFGT